jgi:hypothetical protein
MGARHVKTRCLSAALGVSSLLLALACAETKRFVLDEPDAGGAGGGGGAAGGGAGGGAGASGTGGGAGAGGTMGPVGTGGSGPPDPAPVLDAGSDAGDAAADASM